MIRLLWAAHNHQPVGNFDFIFERAYEKAYRPFLDVLAEFPGVGVTLHFSGILLDWLEANKPEYLSLLKSMVDKGQVEILGGGYYEPILPVISDEDKAGQLGKLNAAVKRLFGAEPRGIWLAERVWEPSLVKPIADAGIEYVVLDGSHFKTAGKSEGEMNGYFVSEEQGRSLKFFPIHDVIRDYIPFRPVEEVLDALLKLDTGGDVQVVFGDDGEKFGDWPFTYDTVYTQGWLRRFFQAAQGMPDRIRIRPLRDGLGPEKNLGLIYMPPASYQEMMVWAQDPSDVPAYREAEADLSRHGVGRREKFLRGAFWRNFFVKYPESNRMHKQGLRLAEDLRRLGKAIPDARRGEILDHLWQAQCNCAYWHGVFGGLYLPHLRFALYRHLIRAQRLIDRAVFAAHADPAWETRDWNFDGRPEHTLNTPEVYLGFTHAGELDAFWLKESGINLADALTRRYEAYHGSVGGAGEAGTKLENQLEEKEAGLRDAIVYDRRVRHSFADLYLAPDTDFAAYAGQKYRAEYAFEAGEVSLERGAGETSVRFAGKVLDAAGSAAMRVEKVFRLRQGTADLDVEWRFRSLSRATVKFSFGCEQLFCLLAGNAPDRYWEWEDPAPGGGAKLRDILASRGEWTGLDRVAVADEWLGLRCEARFPGAARVWRDALETVSRSEGGYEKVYQGSVLIPVWDLVLQPEGEARAALSLRVREKK